MKNWASILLTAASFIVVAEPAYAVSFIVSVATKAIATYGLTAVIAIGVIGFIAVKSIMKSFKKGAKQQARNIMVNKQSNNDPIPVSYGQRRLGGVRVMVDTTQQNGSGGANEYLTMAITLCEGEMGQLKKVMFNDKIIWDHDDGGTYASGSDTTGYLLGGFLTTDPNFGSVSRIKYFVGHPDQTVDTDILQPNKGSSDWTNDHRLRGIAYLAVECKFDQGIFEGGVPTVTAEIAGKKITDTSTLLGSVSTTTSADQNPVDVVYDYLTDTIYGMGIDPGLIDNQSFVDARDYASTRWKINGFLDTDAALFENLQDILNSFNGMLIFTGGEYRMRVKGQRRTPTQYTYDDAKVAFTFDETNVIGDIVVKLTDVTKRLNRMQAGYANKDLTSGDAYEGYNEDQLVVPSAQAANTLTANNYYDIALVGDTDWQSIDADYTSGKTYSKGVRIKKNSTAGSGTGTATIANNLREDQDRVLESRIENDLITDSATLEKLLQYQIDQSRYGTIAEFNVAHTGVQVEPGDIIQLTHPMAGWTNKKFRVMQMVFDEDTSIKLVAQEYVEEIEV